MGRPHLPESDRGLQVDAHRRTSTVIIGGLAGICPPMNTTPVITHNRRDGMEPGNRDSPDDTWSGVSLLLGHWDLDINLKSDLSPDNHHEHDNFVTSKTSRQPTAAVQFRVSQNLYLAVQAS